MKTERGYVPPKNDIDVAPWIEVEGDSMRIVVLDNERDFIEIGYDRDLAEHLLSRVAENRDTDIKGRIVRYLRVLADEIEAYD